MRQLFTLHPQIGSQEAEEKELVVNSHIINVCTYIIHFWKFVQIEMSFYHSCLLLSPFSSSEILTTSPHSFMFLFFNNILITLYVQLVLHMCTWAWHNPLKHLKPMCGYTLIEKWLSLPQQPSSANNTSARGRTAFIFVLFLLIHLDHNTRSSRLVTERENISLGILGSQIWPIGNSYTCRVAAMGHTVNSRILQQTNIRGKKKGTWIYQYLSSCQNTPK